MLVFWEQLRKMRLGSDECNIWSQVLLVVNYEKYDNYWELKLFEGSNKKKNISE